MTTRSLRSLGAALVAGAMLAVGSASAQNAPVATAALASTAVAPATGSTVTFAPVPFAVGEELTYEARFGGIRAGTARLRVDGVELVRGRPAYHLVFTIDGGIPLFRVRDRYESWIDVSTLASLRHRQDIHEGRYRRTTTFEIYPEQAQYQRNDEPLTASVSNPLDDGSFLYAVRTAGVRVGETRTDNRYFKPDRNPVVLTGVRRETVTVGAGTFATTVVRPTIRTKGLFSEDGEAHVWFSDDAHRVPVQLKSRFARLSLTLTLKSMTRGDPAALPAATLAAVDAGGK